MSDAVAPMTLEQLNGLELDGASQAFRSCCAAEHWVQGMVTARPFDSFSAMLNTADQVWAGLDEADWLEAFEAHPQIGNVDTLRAKYANTKVLAAGEQSSVAEASDATIQELAEKNKQYLDRFGFIFIICATGQSADAMLAKLRQRIDHTKAEELPIAAEEQRKITAIRLHKLIIGS